MGILRRSIAVGSGSAYADDRLDAAAALADSGRVSYLGFDCLAERTLALAQVRKMRDPGAGQDQRIPALVPLMGKYLSTGGKIIGNFGAANPDAAEADFRSGLRAIDLHGVRIGVIRGGDVLDIIRGSDISLPELGTSTSAITDQIVSANAYIGADLVVECLADGAQIVLGGRLADPSLFVGPICYEMGWKLDDWNRVADATLIGHLLECGTHGTGGNFEDPPYRVLRDPHNLGYPLAEIDDSGMVITKLDGTGGAVDERIVKTQLYYEIHDPTAYLTPDVTADFSQVTIAEVGRDRMRVGNARGRERPATLKVLVGIDQGWRSIGEMSYAGPGCVERATRAGEIVAKRLEPLGDDIIEFRVDLHGVNAIHHGAIVAGYPAEARLRVAARCATRQAAVAAAQEVELLYFGPAGGGGCVTSVTSAIGVTPAYLPRDSVKLEKSVVES
jgi:hypothetical protein